MSKGEETKQMILARAADLLNQRGYLSSAVSEIMQVTGLQKGGIYNHFASKEDLALQAFDYNVERMTRAMAQALAGKENAIERLNAIFRVFSGYPDGFPVPGGCPVLNSAVESDDAHPGLRERAREAMDRLRNMFVRIVAKGIARGEIRPSVNPDEIATLLISTLEGAIMLSNLYKDPIHLKRVAKYLARYVRAELAP